MMKLKKLRWEQWEEEKKIISEEKFKGQRERLRDSGARSGLKRGRDMFSVHRPKAFGSIGFQSWIPEKEISEH